MPALTRSDILQSWLAGARTSVDGKTTGRILAEAVRAPLDAIPCLCRSTVWYRGDQPLLAFLGGAFALLDWAGPCSIGRSSVTSLLPPLDPGSGRDHHRWHG